MEISVMSKRSYLLNFYGHIFFVGFLGSFLISILQTILPLIELVKGENCGSSTSTINASSIKNQL